MEVEFGSSVVWKTKFEDLISKVEGKLCESSEDNIDPAVKIEIHILDCQAKRHRAHSVVSGVRVKASKPKKKRIPRLGIISARRHRSNP
ncbi:hypothetical protein TNCV_5090161 [Trichonephila clavipes]|nr:hypothetical protein TNCV_5090161 [Trichonephila clavipes]